jgi:L-ascorbate metabolism protein UlaG (beta-lactamase superfamily)
MSLLTRTIGFMRGAVEYLGHSTVLVDLDGARFLTDPLLRSRAAHLTRLSPKPAPPTELTAVLISHGHFDHLDLPSLKLLDHAAIAVVPRGLGGLVRRRGFADVREVVPGDELELGGVAVRVTPALHDGNRAPLRLGITAVGYALLGSARIYFAGDTDLFDDMDGLVPELDVALVPVWGWGASVDKGLHLDPGRAAEAVRRLGPRIAIPIHWGTYAPMGRGHRASREPADAFARAAVELTPDVDVRILEPGERTEI